MNNKLVLKPAGEIFVFVNDLALPLPSYYLVSLTASRLGEEATPLRGLGSPSGVQKFIIKCVLVFVDTGWAFSPIHPQSQEFVVHRSWGDLHYIDNTDRQTDIDITEW